MLLIFYTCIWVEGVKWSCKRPGLSHDCPMKGRIQNAVTHKIRNKSLWFRASRPFISANRNVRHSVEPGACFISSKHLALASKQVVYKSKSSPQSQPFFRVRKSRHLTHKHSARVVPPLKHLWKEGFIFRTPTWKREWQGVSKVV